MYLIGTRTVTNSAKSSTILENQVRLVTLIASYYYTHITEIRKVYRPYGGGMTYDRRFFLIRVNFL